MKANLRRVILYGDSLILQGVHASLETSPELEIITLDPACVSLKQEIRAHGPLALVFDIAAMQPDFPSSLLQQTDLLLIGIDPETHQALVWTGKQAAAVEAADLLSVILLKDSKLTGEGISQTRGKEDG